jgi:hypothetical protein
MRGMTKHWPRLFAIWFAMCVLTLAALAVHDATLPGALGVAGVILAAMIKVRYVILDFMEVRIAPIGLRLVLEGWVILLGTILVLMFA